MDGISECGIGTSHVGYYLRYYHIDVYYCYCGDCRHLVCPYYSPRTAIIYCYIVGL